MPVTLGAVHIGGDGVVVCSQGIEVLHGTVSIAIEDEFQFGSERVSVAHEEDSLVGVGSGRVSIGHEDNCAVEEVVFMFKSIESIFVLIVGIGAGQQTGGTLLDVSN